MMHDRAPESYDGNYDAPASRLKSGQSTAPCCLYVGESNRKVGSVNGTESESRYTISLNDDLASTSPFCVSEISVSASVAYIGGSVEIAKRLGTYDVKLLPFAVPFPDIDGAPAYFAIERVDIIANGS